MTVGIQSAIGGGTQSEEMAGHCTDYLTRSTPYSSLTIPSGLCAAFLETTHSGNKPITYPIEGRSDRITQKRWVISGGREMEQTRFIPSTTFQH